MYSHLKKFICWCYGSVLGSLSIKKFPENQTKAVIVGSVINAFQQEFSEYKTNCTNSQSKPTTNFWRQMSPKHLTVTFVTCTCIGYRNVILHLMAAFVTCMCIGHTVAMITSTCACIGYRNVDLTVVIYNIRKC